MDIIYATEKPSIAKLLSDHNRLVEGWQIVSSCLLLTQSCRHPGFSYNDCYEPVAAVRLRGKTSAMQLST